MHKVTIKDMMMKLKHILVKMLIVNVMQYVILFVLNVTVNAVGMVNFYKDGIV